RLRGAYQSQVVLWDVNTGKRKGILIWDVQRGGEGGPFAFSPDSKLLAAGDDDGFLHLFDLTAREKEESKRDWDTGSDVLCLAFSPNSKLLASGGDDGVVRVWSIPQAKKPDK